MTKEFKFTLEQEPEEGTKHVREILAPALKRMGPYCGVRWAKKQGIPIEAVFMQRFGKLPLREVTVPSTKKRGLHKVLDKLFQ